MQPERGKHEATQCRGVQLLPRLLSLLSWICSHRQPHVTLDSTVIPLVCFTRCMMVWLSISPRSSVTATAVLATLQCAVVAAPAAGMRRIPAAVVASHHNSHTNFNGSARYVYIPARHRAQEYVCEHVCVLFLCIRAGERAASCAYMRIRPTRDTGSAARMT